LDNLLVGKMLGVAALGIYALAFNLSNFMSDYIGSRVSRVLFPAYSKLQDNKDAVKRGFIKVLKTTNMINLPVTLVTFFLSAEIIHVVYGEKWLEVIPVLRILVWMGFFKTLLSSVHPLFMALNKPRYAFLVSGF